MEHGQENLTPTKLPLPPRRKLRWWQWTLLLLAALGLLVVAMFGYAWGQSQARRTAWKTAALPSLALLTTNDPAIQRELASLQTNLTGEAESRLWTGEQVARMTNGEYLIYAFRHGYNNGFMKLDHLFLAHGSDGRWRYSTYHFCNNLVIIWGEDPPGSLAEFDRRYAVRTFDGQSDECLQKTWPP